MPAIKTSRFIDREQSGRRPIPIITVNFDIEDTIRPILLTGRHASLDIIGGYVATRADWLKATRSSVWVKNGKLQLSGAIGGGYAASGYAESGAIDLGYAPRFRSVSVGMDQTGGTVTIKLRTSNTTTFSDGYTTFTTGQSIDSLPARRFLQYKIELAGDGAHTPTVSRLNVIYETQEHFDIVESFGSISKQLALGEGISSASWSPTFVNANNEFADLMARYPLQDREASLVFGYEDSGAADFVVLHTGTIDRPRISGDTGTFDVSGGRIEAERRFPRLRTNDFGRSTNEVLPAYFGEVKRELVNIPPALNDDERVKIRVAKIHSTCTAETWTFAWDVASQRFTITGSTTGLLTMDVQLNYVKTIRNDSNDLLFDVGMFPGTNISADELTAEDGGFFEVVENIEGRAVRLDTGKETTDEGQVWALNQFPGTLTGVYDDDGLITDTEYEVLRTYRGNKLNAIRFLSTNVPNGEIRWHGYGIGNYTNPADIIRALVLYNPRGTERLEETWFDAEGLLNLRDHCSENALVWRGQLPDGDITMSAMIADLCRYLCDVDYTDGRIRLVPLIGSAPSTDDICYTVDWREFSGPVSYEMTSREWIQNDLSPLVWASFGDQRAVISSQDEPRIADQASINRNGYWIGHGRSVKTPFEARFAGDYDTLIWIARNWLDLHAEHKLTAYLNLDSVELAEVRLGDRWIGFDDTRAVNLELRQVGVKSQSGMVTSIDVDVDNQQMTIGLLIWPDSQTETASTAGSLIWDQTAWGTIWG